LQTVIEVVERKQTFIRLEVDNLMDTAKIRDELNRYGKEHPYESVVDIVTKAKELAGENFMGSESYAADPTYVCGFVKAD